MPSSVLDLVYPPDEIFVREYAFDDANLGITVTCVVPSTTRYTSRAIPYVTAENYVRCLSQACYLLAEHALEHGLLNLADVSVSSFRRAAEDYELYYRNLAMTFHQRTLRDTPFVMRLHLRNWQEIRRIRDFLLFTFANERAAISGEMSFVFLVH